MWILFHPAYDQYRTDTCRLGSMIKHLSINMKNELVHVKTIHLYEQLAISNNVENTHFPHYKNLLSSN